MLLLKNKIFNRPRRIQLNFNNYTDTNIIRNTFFIHRYRFMMPSPPPRKKIHPTLVENLNILYILVKSLEFSKDTLLRYIYCRRRAKKWPSAIIRPFRVLTINFVLLFYTLRYWWTEINPQITIKFLSGCRKNDWPT